MLQFGILGPFEVSESGREIALGGRQQRALLALLLLHANETVSTDRLVDELWGEAPPQTAVKTVQVYVSQLRKVLGERVLETRAPGYLLRVEPGQLDLHAFQTLVAEARESEPAEAATKLREALALWRGAPLADFAYEPFAQTEIARLEELRLAALEERIEADLALGRHGELVSELEALVAEQPLRERLRGQLMLGLYRSGRQAEALQAYSEGRKVLTDELGLEPSPALRQLEQAILTQDSSLDATAEARWPTGVVPRPPLFRALGRRGKLLLVAGVVLFASGVGAAVFELTGGGSQVAPVGDAVAVVDPRSGRIASYTQTGAAPSNIAIGEGSAWILSANDQTVSRLDLGTKHVVKTFGTGGMPTDLAVGAGAVWVGNGAATPQGTIGTAYTASVSRVLPDSAVVTDRVRLPGRFAYGGGDSGVEGISRLAVGAGAVWAVDPDLSLSRIDVATGRLVARVRAKATGAIVAGKGGVWFVGNGPSVTRVDPRTNRIGQTIKVTASSLVGLALGAGSIWATDPIDGVVWRIDPGPHPVTRTISVGFGDTHIAFGNGAVWTANFIEGTVSRIDPSTNTVTTTIRTAGTPQGIAVGGGSAWVSVIGEARRGLLPRASCSRVESGGRRPDILIASDLPLQGSGSAVTRSMADGIRYVLRQHGFKAGKYAIGYQSCDDSSAQGGGYDYFKCGANAKAYARAAQLLAVIGTYNSGCTEVELPIVNRAPGGALPMISPANTRPALTRGGITALPGFPGVYYPTGVRNFVRLVAPDDLQGAGDAVLANELGLRRVYVLDDGEDYGKVVAAGFRSAAARLGLQIAGSTSWNPGARDYAALADRIAGTRSRGVLVGGYGSGKLIKALRARLGRKVVLIGADGFLPIPDLLVAAGPAVLGMYVSVAGVTNDKLGPVGRRFLHAFAATQPGGATASGTYLPQAAQGAELLLEAIARSDGTRASVLAQVKTIRVSNGILGSFRFDKNGDMRPSLVTIFRIVGKKPAGSNLVADYRGAVVDRQVSVPANLLP